jgi:hypothetical protein
LKDALANLTKDSGRFYDPRVIAAIENYIHNRRDRLDWLTLSKNG